MDKTTRGRGRPPVGPTIQIRLGPDLLTWIDNWCGDGVSRAAAIRFLINQAAEQYGYSPDAGGLRA